MTSLVSRLAALHGGLWAADPWYQRSWFVAPPAIALVLAGWMISGAGMPGSAPHNAPYNAPWAKPGTSAPASSGGPASKSETTPAQGWLTRGDTSYQQQRYDEAISALTEAIKLDGTLARAYYLRGLAELDKNLNAAAARDFSEYYRLNPSDIVGLRLRGNAYAFDNQYDQAVADYNEALRINPRDQFALQLRARVYYWQKKSDQALADANEALQIDSSLPLASEVRSWVNFDRGKYDAAISDLNTAMTAGPTIDRLQTRGRSLMATGQLDASYRDFKQAEQMDTKSGYTQYLLGLVSERRENVRVRRCVAGEGEANCSRNPDYTETMTYFSRGIELSPEFASCYFDRARILMAQRQYDRAYADIEAGLKLDPNSSEGYLARGNLWLAMERWREAIDDYSHSISISKSAMAFLNRGQSYLKLNDRNNALNDLRSSYALDPNNDYTKGLLRSLGQRL